MASENKHSRRETFKRFFGKLLGSNAENASSTAATTDNKGSAGTAKSKDCIREVTPVAQLQERIDSSTGQQNDGSTATLNDQLKCENLWKKAFERLAQRAPNAIDGYKEYLTDELALAKAKDDILVNSENVKLIVERLERRRDDQQWRLQFSTFLGHVDINLRKQCENLLKFTIWSDEIVKTALSSQPHAGLVWSNYGASGRPVPSP
jgi:hypothetical protein